MTELHKVWLGNLRHDISREQLRAEVEKYFPLRNLPVKKPSKCGHWGIIELEDDAAGEYFRTHCDGIDWPEICSEKLQAGKVKETDFQRGHKYGYRSLGNHDYFRCTSSSSVDVPPVPSKKRPAPTQPSRPPPAHLVEKRAKQKMAELPPPDFLDTPLGRVVMPIHPQPMIDMAFIRQQLTMRLLASSIAKDEKGVF